MPFTDDLSISAQAQIDLKKQEEWEDILEGFLDDPQSSANHLVLGMDINQRKEAELQSLSFPTDTQEDLEDRIESIPQKQKLPRRNKQSQQRAKEIKKAIL